MNEEDMKDFIQEIDILVNNIINMPEYTATGIVVAKEVLTLKIYRLLSDYKRLQKELAQEKENNKYLKTHIFNPNVVKLNYIPKSKIREKIEGLENIKVDLPVEHMKQAQIKVLEELLQEGGNNDR